MTAATSRRMPDPAYVTASNAWPRPADDQYQYVPPRSTVAPTGLDAFAYSACRQPNGYPYYNAHGGGPKRPTWLERLLTIITSEDAKIYATTIISFIVFVAACWYAVNLIWLFIQAGIAAGRAVCEWLTNLPSTIGGAFTRWVEGMRDRLGARLEALLVL